MATVNVQLTDQMEAFVQSRIELGYYGDAAEVVREGLRLLEERDRDDDEKLEWLRAAAKEGFDELDRGEGIAFESMDEMAAYLDQIALEVSAEVKAKRTAA